MLVFSLSARRSSKNVWKRVVTMLKWPNYQKHMASGSS